MGAGWEPRRVQVGDWRVTALLDGTMRLDGGGMWGVVPKAMWQLMTPADEDNTIPLALRPFLLERGEHRVVLEPGIGDHLDPRWAGIYHVQRPTTLAGSLAALGLAPDDITHVVASHCHFDHVGGWVTRAGGALRPLFPRAAHLAPATEIEAARSPDPVRKGGYDPELVAVVERAGLLRGYGREEELLPGLVAHEAAGHSDGVSVLTLNADGPGETAIFWADVVPTSHHVQPAYIMAYDLDVPRSFASRSAWLERAADGGWLGLFYHDVEHAFGRVRRAGKRFAFEPVAAEAVA